MIIKLIVDKEFLLKNSWHDENGNMLAFDSCGVPKLGIEIKKEGNLLMCVDSRECCEGMFEETDCTLEDIVYTLNSYGYTLLAQQFEKDLFSSQKKG